MKKYTVLTSDGQTVEVPGAGVAIDPNTGSLIILADVDERQKASAVFSRGSWTYVIAPEQADEPTDAVDWRELVRALLRAETD